MSKLSHKEFAAEIESAIERKLGRTLTQSETEIVNEESGELYAEGFSVESAANFIRTNFIRE